MRIAVISCPFNHRLEVKRTASMENDPSIVEISNPRNHAVIESKTVADRNSELRQRYIMVTGDISTDGFLAYIKENPDLTIQQSMI